MTPEEMQRLNQAASDHEDWMTALETYAEARIAMKKAVKAIEAVSRNKYYEDRKRTHKRMKRILKLWNQVEHLRYKDKMHHVEKYKNS